MRVFGGFEAANDLNEWKYLISVDFYDFDFENSLSQANAMLFFLFSSLDPSGFSFANQRVEFVSAASCGTRPKVRNFLSTFPVRCLI